MFKTAFTEAKDQITVLGFGLLHVDQVSLLDRPVGRVCASEHTVVPITRYRGASWMFHKIKYVY